MLFNPFSIQDNLTSNGNWVLLSSKCRWFVEARGNVGVDFEAAAGEAEL